MKNQFPVITVQGTRDTIRNGFTSSKAALGALALTAGSLVHAAVPAEVTSELASMKTDGLAVAGVVLVAIIALFAFKFMRKGL